MTTPFLTPELLQRISKLPPSHRKAAMRIVAQEEHARCKTDIFYWIDPTAHMVPYVYTKDPHPMYICNHCTDGEAYHFDKRIVHLMVRHRIEAHDEAGLLPHFTEQSTIRPFPYSGTERKKYIKAIYDQLLKYPLVAVPKSRDMFATWLIITFYTWQVLHRQGRQVIFQSETAMKTRELVDRVDTIWRNQPKWLRSLHPCITVEGTSKAGFAKVPSLQSEIIGFPQGADKIRQYHPTAVFSDEAAFNPAASDTYAAIRPAIQNGGQYVAISSAAPGWFQQICEDSLEQVQ